MRSIVERFVAAVALALLSPLFAAAALLVWLESGSPVYFRQPRVGRNGIIFLLLKFRSMVTNRAGTRITAGNDSRVTRSGAFLRRYKIDELPQLWNILRGDMQFIGPRPEVPDFVNGKDELWKAVLRVKPGLTDPASLVYRHEEAVLAGASNPEELYRERVLPDKLMLSAQYLAQRSLRTDLAIIMLTARYSFAPGGFDSNRIRQFF